MAESVVAFLLDQLSSVLHQEYTNLGGLEREVRYIKDELGSMRAFLRDAEAREDSGSLDFELQEWIKQVREVAYDTEDTFDEFIHRCAPHHTPTGLSRHAQRLLTSFKNVKARRRISSKIRDIKYRIENISARHQRYQLLYGSSDSRGSLSYASREISTNPIRGHALLLEEANLVGIDQPKTHIISQVLDDASHLKLVSVVGMGGLGKTTLVKRVYEAPRIKRAFFSHAWLTISQSFQTQDILKKLIQQLYKQVQLEIPLEVENMDGDGLRAFVKGFLKDKRYIIVLDDLWSMDSWDSIKYALPDDNCGSRVILTTRITDIATMCCRECHGHVHKMRPLSSEDSWTLFCTKTFAEGSCPPHLEEISRSILSKCEGMPLAIVAISGLLALKNRSKVNEWEMVRHSLSGELEGTGKLDRVKKILLLSYNDLPYYLKSCLLYMGIYPGDYQVYSWKLIRLWIAEGFVQERPGMTTIDVAQNYMDELINRSLIQVASTHADGTVQSCRVHDLLYEIILLKSREYNISTVASTPYTRWPENVRHLAVYGFTYPEEPVNLPRLRSLLIGRYINPLSSSSLSKLLNDGPKFLKVLDLRGAQLTNIPEEVFKLFHLNYLNLADTNVEVIPKTIGKLRNLQYINLVGTNVKELPLDILKLKRLRDLFVYRQDNDSDKFAVYGFKAPYGLAGLRSLQYLHFVDADDDKVLKEIGTLKQLRELGITKLRPENGKELCSSLVKLTNLQKLILNAAKPNEILDLQHSFSSTPQCLQLLELRGRLVEVPRWIPCLQGLTVLFLYWSCLREDPLESLEGLQNLAELTLYRAYDGESLNFKSGRFEKLKRLELRKLRGLRVLRFEKETMPNLQDLYMEDCRLLEELPQGVENLSKLQYLGLYDMANKLVSDLKNLDRGSCEYQRISHIAQIFVGSWSSGKWEGYTL